MSEIATPDQLRMCCWRWAMVTVPAIVLIGSLMGILSNSGYDNRWFAALDRPAIVPPGWVFGAVWTTLYIGLGLALAMILHARGAKGRGFALLLFFVQLAANFAWSPLFFAAHQILPALVLLGLIGLLSILATVQARRVDRVAPWLMLPYLVWLGFAFGLNWGIWQLNPGS